MSDPHEVTKLFEAALAEYTGAPCAVAVDCGTSALYLAMRMAVHRSVFPMQVHIPSHTFRGVPVAIWDADCHVSYDESEPVLRGAYRLMPTPVWDCALRFTCGMYVAGQIQCLSFTGHRKRLKLGRGGAILTDDERFANWAREARFGHHHCRPCWMPPQIAALGCQLMAHFYGEEGEPIPYDDIENEYPDLREAQ